MSKKDKKSKQKIKSITDYLLSSGVYLDYERVIVINGKTTEYSVTRSADIISYKYYNTDKPRKLTHVILDHGYHGVNLLINGKEKTFKVHRLVAEAFIDNPENKPEVNHIDGNKNNNSVDNLEWVSGKENIIHAVQTGLIIGRKGEKHPLSKISETTAIKICQLLQENELTYKEIASLTNASYGIVKKIKNKQRWTHISKDYDFSKYISEKERKRLNEISNND